ncbi:MAG: RHS repeat-associated core domain-containing protein [Deltaproteobacteria bacterium]|nr:RHS repeat-associated core domain-containing protein [Deltaproteobacteria bacterium]
MRGSRPARSRSTQRSASAKSLRLRPTRVRSSGLPGQYRDGESGLSQNWHRMYDPQLGRYIQQDPISDDEGRLVRFPAGYDYVAGRPLNDTDSMGLSIDDPPPQCSTVCCTYTRSTFRKGDASPGAAEVLCNIFFKGSAGERKLTSSSFSNGGRTLSCTFCDPNVCSGGQ